MEKTNGNAPEFEETSDIFNADEIWNNALAEAEDELPEIIDPPPDKGFEAKYNEQLDLYRRCLAEFDNYRKRTAKEMAARYDDGVRAACEKLLPIVDNFERAMNACENKNDTFFQGIALIARQFENMLGEAGVKPIAIEPGGAFDPNFHNAVAHTEDENFGPGEVAEVLQKGYVHKDKVLRHAMVKAAN